MLKQDKSNTHLKVMKLQFILFARTTRSPFRYGTTSMLIFLNSNIYFALPLQIIFINILAIVLTLPFFL